MDDDDDIDDDDADDDYNIARPSRRKTRSGPRSGTNRHSRSKGSDDEVGSFEEEPQSESGSDGDWRMEGSKRTSRRRKRKAKAYSPSKRRRTQGPDADDIDRSARITSRGGGGVNYCESDDGEFLRSDEEVAAKEEAEYLEHMNLPYIEKVLDYRPREGTSPVQESAPYCSDFILEKVEFRIKWTNMSFRKCSWDPWETLRDLKGAKRVSNYIKYMEKCRDYFQKEGVTEEEVEEAKVQSEELRVNYSAHEIVNRVIAKRDNVGDDSKTEYLVKWKNLPYRESTWELRADLSSDADIKAIDDFIDRESSVLNNVGKKKLNPFSTNVERPKFKRMAEQPDYLHGEGRTLRDYQLAGLNYLAYSWSRKNNVILADEMGLGKTLQTISFLGWLMYERNVPGQFLVVVPLSTIAAWEREFARWVPDMNVVCYTGDGPSRKMIRDYEFYSTEKNVEKFHVLLSTPELVMQDEDYFDEIRWAIIAVDEAHRLKNETSSLHNTLASLKSANRLLITGTPLQNSVRELWALLHFLNPDVFVSAEEFEEQFSFTALRDPERVSSLHKTLRPYIIRRQKSDVEKSLPKKTYSVLRVGMTSLQQQYYRWLLTRNFAKLNQSGKGRGMGPAQNIRNLLMELKKCCNHPFLFPNFEDTSTTTTVLDLTRPSGKMILLDKLLLRLREKGHRVLIFSQMVRMLDILQDYCRMRQFPCQRLDGSVSNEVRQRAVDHFNAPDSTDFIFLLSTRAGGLGINLATADTVIIFDSDWNPQNDLQAESRAHRIGQKRDVKVFRLLTAETVEEDILERAKRKRVLEHVVIHGVEGGHKAEGKEKDVAFKKEELSAILRFGAEKLFAKDRMLGGGPDGKVKDEPVDCNDSEALKGKASKDGKDEKSEEKKVLAADDIDEILERAPEDESSQVGAAQPSIGDSLLNAFKWADFTVEEEMDEVDDEYADNKAMAKKAANKIVAMDKQAESAKQFEDRERNEMAQEGDSDFWNRVIPDEIREGAIANDVVLGTRRRKRPSTFATGNDMGKRRRVTRTGRSINGRLSDDEDLSAKEQRALLRSFRRYGDPSLTGTILRDAGLESRIDGEVATALLNDCLERARMAIKQAKQKRDDDEDPAYRTKARSTRESRTKQKRIAFEVLGENGVDAPELLKRCHDLQMLRRHIGTFEPDTQFRLKNTIKPPSYGSVRWKAANDAMLLVGVCRHGLGNWAQIAQDSQLGLGDKMATSGSSQSKSGAPDSTKLMRRTAMLLRELERELESSAKNSKSRSITKSESKSADKKKKGSSSSRKAKHSSSKRKDTSKAERSRGGNKSGGAASDAAGGGSSDKFRMKRLALKKSHIKTLQELRSLSKTNSSVEPNEKIKRTKQCLLKLGQAIDQYSDSAAIEVDLWKYVHTVCKTHLAEDRLQGIYKRLAVAEEDGQANRE